MLLLFILLLGAAIGAAIVMMTNSPGQSGRDRLMAPPHAAPRPSSPILSGAYLQEVRAMVDRGNKIEAIKRVRELTGLGLKEAKDFVEGL